MTATCAFRYDAEIRTRAPQEQVNPLTSRRIVMDSITDDTGGYVHTLNDKAAVRKVKIMDTGLKYFILRHCVAKLCSDALSPLDFPPDILDANLVPRLFIVIEPLILGEVNFVEAGVRFQTYGFPFAFRLEVDEFAAAAFELDDVLALGDFLVRIGFWSSFNHCVNISA